MNPQFAGAIFFAIFYLLLLVFTKYTLIPLKDSALIPLLPASLITIIIGGLVGSVFGAMLAKKSTWIRPFLIGLLVACIVLLLLSLIVMAYYYFTNSPLISRLQRWQDYFIFYGVILSTLSLTLGLFLIPFTGLASLYFNKRFWPGLVTAAQKRQSTNNNDLTHE
ncbi:hypothetical protein [Legionella brunensis]|nr:hypothetical protein [Legionella brunensis]